MIKENQRIFNRLLVLIDMVIIFCSMPAAYITKFKILSPVNTGRLPIQSYIRLMAVVTPVYILIYFLNSVYDPKRTSRIKHECFALFKANIVGIGALIIGIYVVIKDINYARSVLGLFFFINVFVTMAFRVVLRKSLRFARKRGYNQKHILLVGYSEAAEAFIDRIVGNPQWGYSVFGLLDDHKEPGFEYKGVRVIGPVSALTPILQENDLEEVAITLALEDYDFLEETVKECEKQGVHTQFIPDYNKFIPSRAYTEDLFGLPLINIRYVPLANGGYAALKRIADFFGALIGIIITSPIMVVAAIMVKLSSPGPVIFKQQRVGLHNKPFNMYKFRSMKVQEDSEEKQGWTTKDDPRVTGIGKFLRRTSLDELPQLFNILVGDMSIVGPRPERPQFVEKFQEEIPRYMIKHQVRPGLTGWAQVNGLRGDTSIEERIEHDIFYIENWTVGFDVKIFFMTFFTGFINKNAY